MSTRLPQGGPHRLVPDEGDTIAPPRGPERVLWDGGRVPRVQAPPEGRFAGRRGALAYTCLTSGSIGRPELVTISATALGWPTAARLQHYPAPVGA
ncbi:hypothetical protein [Streptomyces sp. NPDC018059]|uniref:hypothetical protein n=1 Tax=Streptomyces sp. NPDC018059 TaxID=3365041 RepID=UPI00379EEC73